MYNTEGMKNKLISFSDPTNELFEDWPISLDESATLFGEAVSIFTLPMTISSSMREPAKQSFIQIFKTMTDESKNGNDTLVSAFNNYAKILGNGMIGVMGIVSVVPPIFTSSDFESIWDSGFAGSSTASIITAFVNTILQKFSLGQGITATGSVIVWI